ncbi:SulP family inorganic anion transporter [Frankia nepalensis]|uniref:SulP family inorganic anion transporter n=1 Tax=Frankia nepalensis TaxID=1836974 RepID=A0A937USM1_9ACTN|nr:SulP family inorganic anion transporter [Frankia nepalensis]MBL7499439.1 SulP family inorganic anion transporter [Frankia nepalensis]MBL7511854.1 SulP family inorganic anion transporter [Frankia nepalensis]MBL7629026.1 SulP family inorganic anion transporter [Frankia nepalensis]
MPDETLAPDRRDARESAPTHPNGRAARPGWRLDVEASLVVFLVALPLSLGIAVASGAPVAAGIIAAVVGGVVAGALGGVPLQVSGPAAGLTSIVATVVATFGWRAACFVTAAAGVLQILLGASRIARAVLAISPAVVQGMLAGIGITIVVGQVHVVLGGVARPAALDNIVELGREFGTVHVPVAAVLGLATIGLMLGWPRLPRPLSAVPAPLAAVALVTVASLPFDVPRVALPHDILSSIALPALPGGTATGIATAVLTVALIASVESLLSAVAVDNLHGGPRGNLDRELVAQGAANTVSGLAGGLPVTGVIVRSATNVRAGARTRASTILHGLWMAAFALLLAPLLSQIPLAVLAGLLVVIGAKLVDLAGIRVLSRHGDLATYLATTGGVVILNLLEGVLLGVGVAVLQTLRRALVASVHVHPPAAAGKPWRVVIAGTLAFPSLPRVARQLARLPAAVPVQLDLAVDYLDHAAYTLLDNWTRVRQREGTRVVVNEIGAPVLSQIREGRPPPRRLGATAAAMYPAATCAACSGPLADR